MLRTRFIQPGNRRLSKDSVAVFSYLMVTIRKMELDFLQRYMVKGQGAQVIARGVPAVCQRWRKKKKKLPDVGKGAY